MNLVSKSMVMSLAALSAPSAWSMAVVPGFDANVLEANDDGSTGAVDLGFTANFFGQEFGSVFVNNNGNITFDAPLSSFTPFDLTSTSQVIIAPFFADIDTRGAGSSPVTYGQGTQDGRTAFGVNYVDVGYFSSNDDLLNSLQLILVDRSDVSAGDFDFIFNYDQIQFETGGASGGTNGLGGDSARAGFSNGTGDDGTFFELEGSALNGAFLDGGPNSLSEIGSLTFEVRNGVVAEPLPTPVVPPVVDPPADPPVDPPVAPAPPTVVPTPGAVGMGLVLLGGLAAGRRRR